MNTFDPITTITDCCGVHAGDGGKDADGHCPACGNDCEPCETAFTDGEPVKTSRDGFVVLEADTDPVNSLLSRCFVGLAILCGIAWALGFLSGGMQ